MCGDERHFRKVESQEEVGPVWYGLKSGMEWMEIDYWDISDINQHESRC